MRRARGHDGSGMKAALAGGLRVLALALAAAGGAEAGVFFPRTFTLDNGLRVVVIENRRAPVVVQHVWYRVGAADEAPGEGGLAHFVEHLMFKGTGTRKPGEFSRIIERVGASDNAFTSYDYTAYFQRVAAHEIETVMRLEADRMRNLVLTDDVVLPERGVVEEERLMRTDNRPSAQLGEQMRRALFLNHPYGRPLIGWPGDIRRLDTAGARAFYRRHYAPNNAILIVAGDVSADRVRELARRHYGPVPRRAVPPRARPAEPPHHAARRVVLKSPRQRVPSWSRIYLAPSFAADPDGHAYALEVLAEVLGGGTTSRLYRRLVVDLGIVTGAGAWYSGGGLDHGTFGVHVGLKPDSDVGAIEAVLDRELDAALGEGFDEVGVARARKGLAAAAVYARDGIGAGAHAFGRAFTQGRTVEDVEAWPERIAAVTPEQVLAAAKNVLDLRRSVTGILLPGEGAR